MPNGAANPSKSVSKYLHIAHLLQNVERSFVLGSDYFCQTGSSEEAAAVGDILAVSSEERSLTVNPHIVESVVQLENLDHCEKGYLWYKRTYRKFLRTKPWKRRYFLLRERTLLCYRSDDPNSQLLRAIPLLDCEIESERADAQYEYSLNVKCPAVNMIFHLRADDAETYHRWTHALQR